MDERLYILIDDKLSSGQKMSQSCHAAAEFMLKHPGIWNNSTIIILDAPRYVIDKMISKGALGYQDIYYDHPKAAAFHGASSLTEYTKDLKLAR